VTEPESGYEAVILRDCRDPAYPRNRKLFWAVYLFFAGVLALLYGSFFHWSLVRNVRYAWELFQVYLRSTDPGFRAAIFVYQYLIGFLLFGTIVAVFALFGLWAYDMQKRNQLIRKLISVRNVASASELKNS
jgi:hypothetical protein